MAQLAEGSNSAKRGTWFHVPDRYAIATSGRRKGKPFSDKPTRRPFVMAKKRAGNFSTFFPRTTKEYEDEDEEQTSHREHRHIGTHPSCVISECGWVVNISVSIRNRDLTEPLSSYSCEEDNEQTGLVDTIEEWMKG